MRVLVTGGAGFIGSHIVDALIDEGHRVAVVDDLSTGRRDNAHAKANLYEASVTDGAALKEVFAKERPQLVSHQAAHASVTESMADPVFDAQANIIGSLNVLRLCLQHGVEKLIFASTSAAYSEAQYLPMDEAHPTEPQSAYGLAKLAAERYIGLFGRAHGLRHTTLRYGNVYGPRQRPDGESGVVAIFTGQLLDRAQPTIFGDESKTRDYVYVDDVVQANVLAMGHEADGEVLNIARGVEVSDLLVFQTVGLATGVCVEPRYADKRPGELDRVSLDASKAREVLGWTPSVGFEEGVRRVVEDHLQRRRGGMRVT
jgi:UDP-glucose 4-epimerase